MAGVGITGQWRPLSCHNYLYESDGLSEGSENHWRVGVERVTPGLPSLREYSPARR